MRYSSDRRRRSINWIICLSFSLLPQRLPMEGDCHLCCSWRQIGRRHIERYTHTHTRQRKLCSWKVQPEWWSLKKIICIFVLQQQRLQETKAQAAQADCICCHCRRFCSSFFWLAFFFVGKKQLTCQVLQNKRPPPQPHFSFIWHRSKVWQWRCLSSGSWFPKHFPDHPFLLSVPLFLSTLQLAQQKHVKLVQQSFMESKPAKMQQKQSKQCKLIIMSVYHGLLGKLSEQVRAAELLTQIKSASHFSGVHWRIRVATGSEEVTKPEKVKCCTFALQQSLSFGRSLIPTLHKCKNT